MGLLTKLFGDYSTKEIKRIRPLCDKVLKLEDEFSKLTDEQLVVLTSLAAMMVASNIVNTVLDVEY